MQIMCPQCQGTGVMILIPKNLTVPKDNMQDLLKVAEKKKCHRCNGAGEIPTGWLYQELVKSGELKEGGVE